MIKAQTAPTVTRHELGVGHFNWHRHERVYDRYGMVLLFATPAGSSEVEESGKLDRTLCDKLQGKRGRLVVEVINPRMSGHIGDVFRKVAPPEIPPLRGERIQLCCGDESGIFVTEECCDDFCIGIEPDDERQVDWLDIKKLYRAHDQLVKLFFEEHA